MKENKRIIVTGGPSCGKTTVLKYLEQQGYTCIPETAREVLEEKIINPKSLEFQLEIFKRQLEKEKNYRGFFDRSALDGIAYCKRNFGYVPFEINSFEFSNRYDLVFILEELPLKQDGVRTEKSDEEVKLTSNLIQNAYQEKGYQLISVPVFPGKFEESVKQRAEFILKHLEARWEKI